MDGAVTWPQLAFIVSAIVSAGGIVAAIVIRVLMLLWRMQREHDAFKTKVAETYAPLAALYKVEARIADEMRELRKGFDDGFGRVIEIMKTLATRRRSAGD